MLDTIRRTYWNLLRLREEDVIIKERGHRAFVGGRWDDVGRLQFDFLIEQGLKPSHVLLDIGCGALRGGRFFIEYLEAGNYLGIDKHSELIEAGKTKEIQPGLLAAKRPEFVLSDRFEFERFSKQPQVCLAQSVFTHLSRRDIELCFEKLSSFAGHGCRLFATFFETSLPLPFTASSHSSRAFFYTRRQMERLGRRFGWEPRYIGNWDHPHPTKPVMIEYVKC
jgi:SAM-dependent methyltransferase